MAPGLNDYEISLYLTQAHRELVNNYYNGNYKGDSIESSEKVRSLLNKYIKEGSITDIDFTMETTMYGIRRTLISLPSNVWRLLSETIIDDGNMAILVKPITYDDWQLAAENPFRKPNSHKAWRLDINVGDEPKRQIIIMADRVFKEYKFVYLKYPDAIILSDLDDTLPGLEISGMNQMFIPDYIDNFFWELIINRAVELATRDYKDNNLSTQVQLNQRDE